MLISSFCAYIALDLIVRWRGRPLNIFRSKGDRKK